MKKKKAKFTKACRQEAAKPVTEKEYKQIEVAKNRGIDAKHISRWVQERNGSKKAIDVPYFPIHSGTFCCGRPD